MRCRRYYPLILVIIAGPPCHPFSRRPICGRVPFLCLCCSHASLRSAPTLRFVFRGRPPLPTPHLSHTSHARSPGWLERQRTCSAPSRSSSSPPSYPSYHPLPSVLVYVKDCQDHTRRFHCSLSTHRLWRSFHAGSGEGCELAMRCGARDMLPRPEQSG